MVFQKPYPWPSSSALRESGASCVEVRFSKVVHNFKRFWDESGLVEP
jgi:hypothetical protein